MRFRETGQYCLQQTVQIIGETSRRSQYGFLGDERQNIRHDFGGANQQSSHL